MTSKTMRDEFGYLTEDALEADIKRDLLGRGIDPDAQFDWDAAQEIPFGGRMAGEPMLTIKLIEARINTCALKMLLSGDQWVRIKIFVTADSVAFQRVSNNEIRSRKLTVGSGTIGKMGKRLLAMGWESGHYHLHHDPSRQALIAHKHDLIEDCA